MKKKVKHILFLSFIITNCSFKPQTEAEEYNLKAAFIYNFTNFVEWSPSNNDDPFVIGIVGPSVIKDPLMEIAKTKKVNNKRIVIREFAKPEDITFCNILFISQKTAIPLDMILSKGVSKNMLTIAEKNGYASEGVGINFVIINDKLKFETNLSAINSAGLKVSSQLLKLAIIVN
jgi:hypothetical protein